MKLDVELDVKEAHIITNCLIFVAKQSPIGGLLEDLIKKLNNAIQASKEKE
jgi:hypothetical protein